MGYIKFWMSIMIVIYVMYNHKLWNIDKSILGTLVGLWMLFEHHINRIIDILNK